MAMIAATSAFAADLAVVSTYTLPEPQDILDLEIPASAFADLNANSTIRVNFGETDAEGQVSICCKVGAAWTWTKLIDWTDAPLTSYDYKLADAVEPATAVADYLPAIKERGIILQGQKHTVVSVQVLQDAGSIVTYELVDEYTLAAPVTFDWNTEPITIPADKFAKITDKSKIELYYTPGATNPQMQLATNDPEWKTVFDYYNLNEGGVMTIKMDEFAQISQNMTATEFMTSVVKAGLFVKGNDYTFNGMKLYNPGNSGIADAVASEDIDFNAPVEIYNLQGMRVAEMTEGNLYIVRQGNVVKKIVK